MRGFGRRGDTAVATYAAVLDGVHLWLDVDGPVSVREAGGRAVTELGDHPYDLSGLTGSVYEVLSGRSLVSLEPSPASVPASSLTRTPLSPDGLTQWEVLGGDPLRLTRRAVAPTAELDAVDLRGDAVHLSVRPPAGAAPGGHLLLLDTGDQVRATLPMTAHDGLVEALVGPDELPAGYVGMLRLAVGNAAASVRIRRRGNDLTDPHHAVLLPELHADGHPLARLRWNPDGLLALRVLGPDEAL
jgi:hypothetical protein